MTRRTSAPRSAALAALVLLSSASIACDSAEAERDRRVSFGSEAELVDSLAEFGVAVVRVDATGVELIDRSGVPKGHVELQLDGTIVAEFDGATLETRSREGSMVLTCNERPVELTLGDRLSATASALLEPCARVSTVAAIVVGSTDIIAPVATLDAGDDSTARSHGDADMLATPLQPAQNASCWIVEQGCWSWTQELDCIEPVTCYVDVCDYWYVCQPGHWY